MYQIPKHIWWCFRRQNEQWMWVEMLTVMVDWIGLDWVSNLVDSVGLKNGPMDISVLDPIQPNPQTHWPNLIRSTICACSDPHPIQSIQLPAAKSTKTISLVYKWNCFLYMPIGLSVYTDICSAFWIDACSHWREYNNYSSKSSRPIV